MEKLKIKVFVWDSWLGMSDILAVLAERPTKYIVRKKPGQGTPYSVSPFRSYILKSDVSAYCMLHPNKTPQEKQRVGHVQRKDN